MKYGVSKVWSNEAQHFTPWLASEDGLARLGDAIGLELVRPTKESKVASSERRCDIEAEAKGENEDSDSNEVVVIENQLEKTDFSHLGRIVLYAAQRDAKHVIWVVKDVTPDHRTSIAWLNKNTTTDVGFYLVKITVFDRGEKRISVMFSLVEGPDAEAKVRASGTPQQKFYMNFWKGFSDFASSDSELSKVIPSFQSGFPQNWYSVRIGTTKCDFTLCIARGRLRIEIVVHDQESLNKLRTGEEKLKNCFPDTEYREPDSTLKNPKMQFANKKLHLTDKTKDYTEFYQWFKSSLLNAVPIVKKIFGVSF